jgi:hypothetical protein
MRLLHAKLRRPSHFQPWQYEALGLWACGVNAEEIAEGTGQEESAVKKLMRTPAAKQLLDRIRDGILATVRQAQQEIQLLVPRALAGLREELELPVGHPVRHKAEMAILAMGGHTPTQRVLVMHEDPAEDLEGSTLEQLRERAWRAIHGEHVAIETSAIASSANGNDESEK